jgi:hypothetical protein
MQMDFVPWGGIPNTTPPCHFTAEQFEAHRTPPARSWGWVWAVVVATMGLIDKGPEGTATPTPPCGFDARERTATQDI